MNFNVKDVEFDFDDDYANGFKLTFDEEIELRDLALGVWEADDEDEMEWIGLLREKVDSIMVSQINYEHECG